MEDAFSTIVAELDTVVTDRPSVELQRETLAAVHKQHYDQWADSGLLFRAYGYDSEHIPGVEELGIVRTLRNSESGDIEPVEQLSLMKRIPEGENASRFEHTPVSEYFGGMLAPAANGKFTSDDAELITVQALELISLKEQGILPDLEMSSGSIFDVSTSMTAYRPPQQEETGE